MKILHLSDLHYGLLVSPTASGGTGVANRSSASAHAFLGRDGLPDPSWLANVLCKQDQDHLGQPDVVAVSGDIGWSGDKSDYDYAYEFLSNLRTCWPKAEFVLTLGNHDVSWARSKKGQNPQAPAIEFLQTFYGIASFSKLFACDGSATAEAIGRRTLTSVLQTDGALFATANSAAGLDHENKDFPAFIPAEALMQLSERLRSIDPGSRKFRVFVMHHHLLPFIETHKAEAFLPTSLPSGPDETTIANSAQLQNWLAMEGFDLVLHGHRHSSHARLDILKTAREDNERRLIVVGAGSASVHQKELPPGQNHSYNTIRVSPGQRRRWSVRVETRNIDRRVVIPPSRGYVFKEEAGPESRSVPNAFCGENWHDLHEAIANNCWPLGIPTTQSADVPILRNFISVLEAAPDVIGSEDWTLPPTCWNGNARLTRQDIEKAFRALHPEYIPSAQWRLPDKNWRCA